MLLPEGSLNVWHKTRESFPDAKGLFSPESCNVCPKRQDGRHLQAGAMDCGAERFWEITQGFDFLMKDLWGMFSVKLKSTPHLTLGNHFIVSSQGLSAYPWLLLQRRGGRLWHPAGKCKTFFHHSACCSAKTRQSTSRTPLLWCCYQTGVAFQAGMWGDLQNTEKEWEWV